MSAAQPAIRVVIVEDSPTMRAILKTRLERDGDIVVVGAAADAAHPVAARSPTRSRPSGSKSR